MRGYRDMSVLPPGMDGKSCNRTQAWQQNAAETIARTEPRIARRARDGSGIPSTGRLVVTPEPESMDDRAPEGGLDTALSASPRSTPGGEKPRDRRHRIGSISSSFYDAQSQPGSDSVKSDGLSRTSSQLRKSSSVKKDKGLGRRLVKRSRPPSPAPEVNNVPSIDSLSYPVNTGDANKILLLMRTLCGRMKGEVDFQTGGDGVWQKGACYIDDMKGSLMYEGDDSGPFHITIVQDLRGCRVRLVTLTQRLGRCLEISDPTSGVEVRMIPNPPVEFDLWLAALLCYQQIRTVTLQASPRAAESQLGDRPTLPRLDSSASRSTGNIIKVAKLLLWDKGAPSSPSAVVNRPSTRDLHSSSRSWRRVSCILQDNGEFKLLTENDVTLLSVIQLSQLSRSAIQRLDKSVLGEEYCIAIFPIYTPTSSQLSIFRPVYIALESRALMEVWFVLLRAFSMPEIYGPDTFEEPTIDQSLAQPNQGMFRIERSLNVRVIEAKIRGSMTKHERSEVPCLGKYSMKPGLDPSVGDYLAEIVLDGEVRARTMTKADTRNPFWREDYDFHDLPAHIPRVSVIVKRIDHQVPSRGTLSSSSVHVPDQDTEVVCGKVEISMDTLERGKDAEKWCQIFHDRQQPVGELFIKIRLDELVVLLAKDYQPISELLHNFSSGLTQQIAEAMPSNLKKLTETLMNIYQVSGHSSEWLMALVEDEIDGVGKDAPLNARLGWSRRMGSNESFGSVSDREQTVRDIGRSLNNEANLLFRGNSLLTQSLDFHMRRLGKEYLNEVLSEKIAAINALNPDCEVDPSRLSHSDDLDRNWTSLIALTTDVWDGIAESANRCPGELRQILKYIRACAEDRFGDFLRTVAYTSISGFLFLRFFCPAILNPKLFGLLPDHPQPRAQRTLTLIAKSLQALANLATFGQKEAWTEPMNRFLGSHRQALKDFLDTVCSIPAERYTFALPASYSTPITILARLPPTSREGFPSLPYLIDHASNFAALVKLWLDSPQHDLDAQPLAPSSDLYEFNQHCIELQRRTDECLTRAGAGDHLDQLDLHWDDVVENFDSSTSLQESPLPRPEAEVLRSSRWAEYTASITIGPPPRSAGSEAAEEDNYKVSTKGKNRHSLTFLKDSRDISSSHKSTQSDHGFAAFITSPATSPNSNSNSSRGPSRNGKQSRSFLGGLRRKGKDTNSNSNVEKELKSPTTPSGAPSSLSGSWMDPGGMF